MMNQANCWKSVAASSDEKAVAKPEPSVVPSMDEEDVPPGGEWPPPLKTVVKTRDASTNTSKVHAIMTDVEIQTNSQGKHVQFK